MTIATLAPYATFAILLLAVLNFFLNMRDRKHNQESSARKDILSHMAWTGHKSVELEDYNSIIFRIHNPSSYIFNGVIEKTIFKNNLFETKRFHFNFEKSNRKLIYITIKDKSSEKENKIVAKLEHINPELFNIRLKKSILSKKNPSEFDFINNLKINPVEGYEVNNNKLLTDDILDKIRPKLNYDKVKELLGTPNKEIESHSFIEDDCFENEKNIFHSDLYFLKNAILKVTTTDKKSIHSISILGHESNITLPKLDIIYNPINEYDTTVIIKEMINDALIVPIRTMKINSTAIQHFIGPPFREYVTYFVDGDVEEDNTNCLVGREIIGFCISSDKEAFYIYDYEII